ncbi:TadE-like protein [Novipirellula artificiosorum]|uniref:TadE-like protein n=2 Tax=Novipirellula artificiosorum TaxID=2528016 RepID=A0A5C6D6N4_9BACT|nr:TadE-like protein [Novipirellula artificiosorum]
MTRKSKIRFSTVRHHDRRAVAAVEFAVIAPVLMLIVLGAIDVGQSINVAQILDNASREGARFASRLETTTQQQVESAVQAYVADAFASTSSGDLGMALTVNVGSDAGSVVSGGDLTTIESGANVSVQVALDYETVRWMGGLPGFGTSTITATTVMRRE